MHGAVTACSETRPAQTGAFLSQERRARLKNNLAALSARRPELAAAIDAASLDESMLVPAAHDQFTVRLTADDGRAIFAHSTRAPLAEAERLVDAALRPGDRTFALAGLGAGYVLATLQKRLDQPVMIVFEDDLALIKTALCLQEVSGAIAAGRLIFITAADKQIIHSQLHTCNADILLGLRLINLPHTRRFHVEFQARCHQFLMDFISYARMQIVTLLKTSRVTFENISHNLVSYLSGAGIDSLKDAARGYPAVVVAAGPSLARNAAQLAGLRDKAVIIAVQTIFKLLLELGCEPHFVTSLDFHEISTSFFEGVRDVGDCTLVAEPKATWKVLDNYPGRVCTLHHSLFEELLRDDCPQRGGLQPGSTVAHLAFYLAQHLGCDPIILVGQDLCFSQGMFYLAGTPVEDIWRPELGRFQTVEMKQWERIVRNRPILRPLVDANGAPAYADDMLFSYAEQFELDFQRSPARVINATEGGAPLKGAQPLDLAQAAGMFCTRPLPAALRRAAVSGERGPDWSAALSQLKQRAAEIDQVRAIACQTLELLVQLDGLVHEPARFNKLVARVDSLRAGMQQQARTYKLLVGVSQTAELRRYNADRQLGRVQRETPETARQRLARDREFVSCLLDGCAFLQQLLPRAIQRIEVHTR